MNILVIAEHDNVHIKPSCFSTIGAAINLVEKLELDNPSSSYSIDILFAGLSADNRTKITEELKNVNILNKILYAANSSYEHGLAENIADLIVNIANDYHYILFPATTYGKNIAPRVAALLDVNLLSDVIEIVNHNTFKRPIYAGNAIATMRINDALKLFSIRTTCFEIADSNAAINSKIKNSLESVNLDFVPNKSSTKFIKDEFSQSVRPELPSAKIVVSGGRALQNQENFKLIEDLADKLNAAVGASRAAVDAGYAPNDYQVGQTGKVVAPDLYIAIGISGAIQHLAGILGSKVIVAINKDPEAPIFKVADYGLVGDLFTIVPELTIKIAELNK